MGFGTAVGHIKDEGKASRDRVFVLADRRLYKFQDPLRMAEMALEREIGVWWTCQGLREGRHSVRVVSIKVPNEIKQR